MKLNKKNKIIAVYGFGHFYIDFVCNFSISAILLFNLTNLNFNNFVFLIIAYNLLQLATQPFFGLLMDYYNKPKLGAILGLILTCLGGALIFNPLIAIPVFAIGNAIYHVAGGLISLRLEPGKSFYPGMFVGPGAMGLFLGVSMKYLDIMSLTFFAAITFLVGLYLLFLLLKCKVEVKEKKIITKTHKSNFVFWCACLLLVSVGMRSVLYGTFVLSWSKIWIYGLLLAIAITLGKMLGGYFADRYGWKKVGMIGLLTAVPLMTVFAHLPLLAMIGAFCFNLVMPITLTALANLMPKYKATAFGLTAMALILGSYILAFFKKIIVINNLFVVIVLIINVMSLFLGLYNERKNVEKI